MGKKESQKGKTWNGDMGGSRGKSKTSEEHQIRVGAPTLGGPVGPVKRFLGRRGPTGEAANSRKRAASRTVSSTVPKGGRLEFMGVLTNHCSSVLQLTWYLQR